MAATRYFTGNLKTAAPGAPFNAVWVRLVSNTTGQAFVSATATDGQGNFSIPNVPPGSFSIQTAPASTGPWTPSPTQRYTGETDPESTYRATLTPASVAANTSAEQTFSVPGLVVGDVVGVNPPSLQAGLAIAHARVSATDTLAIAWINATAGPLTPPSGTYLVAAVRS
jgi:hypothetical protein